MKNNQKFLVVLVFVFTGFHTTCFSQPDSGVYSGLYGWIGEKEPVTYFNSGSGLNEGPSGINVNWDLSAYSNAFNIVIERRSPIGAPHASIFAKATDVELIPLGGGDTLYTFYSQYPGMTYSVLGSFQISDSKLIIYDKPRILIDHGVKNYGDSIVNSYTAKGTFDSSGIPGTLVRHGILKRYYDAFGSLKTPYANINNDGRFKIVEHYIDSVTINGKLQIHVVDELNFVWTNKFDPVRHASITHIKRDGITKDQGFFKCVGCKVGVNTFNRTVGKIMIRPQPGNDIVKIECDVPVGEYAISITDLSGKMILDMKSVFNETKLSMDLNTTSLANGIYFIRLTENQNIFIKKLVINH